MDGIVKIHGKDYQTVAKRVADFREAYRDFTIETDVISAADLVCVKAFIKNEDGRILATGYAEEVRGATNINKTSALENCETSAVGRALAFFGFGGEQIATANEVNDAILQQAKLEVADYFKHYNGLVRDNLDTISLLKESLQNEDFQTAAGCWADLGDETQRALWIAPSNGGIFTTKERELIKSKEFREAGNE